MLAAIFTARWPDLSIEEAVHREVFEEVDIHIKNLQYYGSQSWPFPNSLMLGFHAEYESGELELQEDEILDAQWFHHQNLPNGKGSPGPRGGEMKKTEGRSR